VNINVSQSIDLTPDSITSHVYDNGEAYLQLGTDRTIGQSIMIWAGKPGADRAEEARALRKLAEVASELAAGLEPRTGGAS
jgi:hypothetical protein